MFVILRLRGVKVIILSQVQLTLTIIVITRALESGLESIISTIAMMSPLQMFLWHQNPQTLSEKDDDQ